LLEKEKKSMAHEFKVKNNGNVETYTNYDDIPNTITAIVHYNPDLTGASDAEIVEWSKKYGDLQAVAQSNQ
jgi:hypothetical protein